MADLDPVHYDDGSVLRDDRDPHEGTGPGWYFYDETWAFRFGPYDTEVVARHFLTRYVREVLRPREPEGDASV